MTHPFGAIETVEELAQHIGKTLYKVYGLGEGSFIYPIHKIQAVESNRFGDKVLPYFSYDNSGHCHPGDMNIEGHCNSHYLFFDIQDAEAYLEYAKTNTKRISSWWENDLFYGDD